MKAPKLTRGIRKAVQRVKHAKGSLGVEGKEEKLPGKAISMPKQLVATHKKELSELEQNDPEFFQFLKENDENLLNFEMEDDDDDEGEEDLEEEDIQVKGKSLMNLSSRKVTEVDESILSNTISLARAGSLRALQRLLSIFRAACIPSGSVVSRDDASESAVEENVGKFIVNSPLIYEKIMSEVFGSASDSFAKILDLSEGTTQLTKDMLEAHPKWKKIKSLVQSFFHSVLHTLSGLAASNSPGEVFAFIISSIESFIPLVSPLPRLAKGIVNVLLTIWSHNSPVNDGGSPRIHAYLRIRQISLVLPGAMSEDCFKSIYLSYARHAKTFSTVTSASVQFMSKCVVELYVTDAAMAYQNVFIYIRQLALLLRSAVQKKTADASKQVLNWQYLNCVRVWTRVICAMPKKEDLGELAFPLAQIILGVIAAAPSAINIPLRMHLISCLHQLAAHCQLFIPTAAKLLETLDIADLFSKPVPSTDAPPALQHIVRFLPGGHARANVRDLIVSEIVTLLHHDADIYRYSAGFPEYAYFTIRKLRVFIKKSKISRWRDLCRSLVNQLEQQSSQIKKLRCKLGKSPMEVTDFEALLPASAEPAHARLSKLMAGRNTVGDVAEITVDAGFKAPLPAKGIMSSGNNHMLSQGDGNEDEETKIKPGKKKKAAARLTSLAKNNLSVETAIKNAEDEDKYDKVEAFEWSSDEEGDN